MRQPEKSLKAAVKTVYETGNVLEAGGKWIQEHQKTGNTKDFCLWQ
jgi:hypothetical protein